MTAAQSYALMDLAALARDDAAALACAHPTGAARTGATRCRQIAVPPRADFLERYGHRAVYETYLRHPRWREAPDYLLDSVLNLIGADPRCVRQEAAARAGGR